MDAVSFEAARDIVLKNLPKAPSGSVSLLESLGRVLAFDVTADRDHPGEDCALRDGFALAGAATRNASPAAPITLCLAGRVAAGELASFTLGAGQCAAVATGAPIPAGADAVVAQEDVREGPDHIVVEGPVRPRLYVRRRGDYFREGDVLAPAGRVIRPEEIQTLAAAGHSAVPIVAAPRVAVISTGSELVDVGEAVGLGQLRASNLYYIAAYIRLAGGSPDALRIVPDRPSDIRAALEEAQGEFVVTTGGTAGGPKDYMRSVLDALGATVFFERVEMAPGKSFTFARLGEKAVFCFPGSPGASRTLAWLFLCPAIRMVACQPLWEPLELVAVLEKDLRTPHGLTRFLPCRVSRHAEGLKAAPVQESDRDLFVPSPEVNALLVVPADVDFLESGYEARVVMIGDVMPDPEEYFGPSRAERPSST